MKPTKILLKSAIDGQTVILGTTLRRPTEDEWLSACNDLNRLSSRQLECLRMLSKGMMVQEISKMLGIGSSTVQTHIRRTVRALQVSTTTEAIVIAARAGLT